MKQAIACALLVLAGIVTYAIVRSRSNAEEETASGTGAQTITLRGATQFDESHSFTRALRRFEQRVQEYYDGPVEFELYLNSELGLEKDYFAYMNQGLSVDYAIVSPAHMSTFSPAAPFMDAPFLFKDLEHWKTVLSSDAFDPIRHEISDKADVMLIGYAGGGVRNLIAKQPVTTLDQLRGLDIRVMGAPIQTRIFEAIGASPTVISYSEVYNAMQTGVIDAAENEAAGTRQMKFYEVGPEISLTQHAITVRPICFSGKTFRKLPEALQEAILRAGAEAGAYGRELESSEDASILAQLEEQGKVRVHEFKDRDRLRPLATPVIREYAREVGAEEVLARIESN